MLVTLLGISMLVKLLQSSNAHSPMLVTLCPFIVSGIITSVDVPLYPAIVITPSFVNPHSTPFSVTPHSVQFHTTGLSLSFHRLSHPLGSLSATQYIVKLLQLENADSPMLVTLLGITMLVKLLQPLNAYLPMLVTLSGISMFVKLLQPKNAELPMLSNCEFSPNITLVNPVLS